MPHGVIPGVGGRSVFAAVMFRRFLGGVVVAGIVLALAPENQNRTAADVRRWPQGGVPGNSPAHSLGFCAHVLTAQRFVLCSWDVSIHGRMSGRRVDRALVQNIVIQFYNPGHRHRRILGTHGALQKPLTAAPAKDFQRAQAALASTLYKLPFRGATSRTPFLRPLRCGVVCGRLPGVHQAGCRPAKVFRLSTVSLAEYNACGPVILLAATQ